MDLGDFFGIFCRMKRWPLIFGSCCIVVGGCTSPMISKPAPSNATQQQAATATLVAGEYSGNWSNSDGATGTVRVNLIKADNSPWQASVSFTYDGNDAATTMKSVAVNGNQILLAYDYKVQDSEGAVEMTGTLAGNTLQGGYRITKGDGNPGTWQATRVR
jgi:hypothetical protein